jgi:RNA polymerase sigma-70 factor (sigma-E family)
VRQDLRESFAAFVTGELTALRRLAYALSGDGSHADDLVQGALERMYLAWPRAHRATNPGAYLRTVLVRLAISESRRPFRSREVHLETLPGSKHQRVADASGSTADRLDLAAALNVLTPKQRAIVALRYLEDRAVSEVADILGISAGTVKRQSHDAMAILRRHLSTPHDCGGAPQATPLEEGRAR